jgi:hypothetical protein
VSLQSEFSSYYKIDKHIKNSKHYIAPRELKLPPNEKGKVATFQYIPIIDLVEAIITDPGYTTAPPSPDGVLYDIKDGAAWKNNKYFQENPDALTGQMHSDALELVNPLGAAKGVHKIVNFYFCLVDVAKNLRSKTENIMLVLSVKEKHLKENYIAVLTPLLEDLLKLEAGVKIGGRIVKMGLICYSADNLEAHVVGGFSQSFSSGKFFFGDL